MSGISGIYFFDGRTVSDALIGAMHQAISHRGIDGGAIWNKGSVGLGFQRLATTPESVNEVMPLPSANHKLFLTADAIVDNRQELIEKLALQKSSNALTDSEIILASYQRWGENCAAKIVGDFAFAIWDEDKKNLFCARDAFGVKPFYYYRSEKFFAFASEIKALLAFQEIPKKLNEVMVADHLIWSTEDKEITFYKDIFRLLPAHTLTISQEKIIPRRYWDLNPLYELKLGSDRDYEERFLELFGESVRCRLRSAFPVGSLLSGGLDSSSIVSMATKIYSTENKFQKNLHTFSAVFDDVPVCDERSYIDEVTSLSGIKPHYTRADRIPPFYDIQKIFWHLDEPHYCNLTMFWGGFYPQAKDQNVRVLLDGDGGDDIVSHGYARLAELFGSLRWAELLRSVWVLSKNTRKPFSQVLWNKAMRPFLPTPIHQLWRQIRWGGRPLWLDDTVLNASFGRRVEIQKRAKLQLGHESELPKNVRQDDWQGLQSGAVNHGFEISNRIASAFSVEQRYPFFDRRLVEFCLSLPSHQKMRGGWTRVLMRRAMKGILPERIRQRSGKAYLDSNITHGLMIYERQAMEEAIVHNKSVIANYVDMDALRKVYASFLLNPTHESTTTVWQVTMLSLWLRQTGLEP